MTPADPQPEPCTAHTSGHSNISTHKQNFQQQPTNLAPHNPDCRQVLNPALAQITCPGKLPEVIQGCQTSTLPSEITDRLLCGLQEERTQGKQILHHPWGQCQGRIPLSPSTCCSLQPCCCALPLLLHDFS